MTCRSRILAFIDIVMRVGMAKSIERGFGLLRECLQLCALLVGVKMMRGGVEIVGESALLVDDDLDAIGLKTTPFHFVQRDVGSFRIFDRGYLLIA